MRPVHPNFRIAQAASDSPIRTLCEAQAEQRSDILRTKADLQSADTFTARSADFPAGNSLTAAAATTEATLASAPAANALYEPHFKVTITPVVPGAGTNTHTVVVAVETDPLATGVWTEQWAFTYEVIRKTGEPATAVVWPSERMPVRVTGIAAGGKLRLKIKTATGPGGWSFAVHGFNLATDLDLLSGVTYHTGPAIDFLDGGGATLADTVVSKISLGTSDGYELDLNGPALSPDVSPFIVARTVWGKDDSADIAIDRFTAQLHPKQNGANPKDVAWFICQPYALKRSGPSGSQNAGALTELWTELVPLCDPVRVPAGDGTSAQDYVFSFYDRDVQGPGHTIVTMLRKPRPKSVRPEFVRRDGNGNFSTLPESEYDGSPTTFWFIWAVTADGTPATNVGWARDSGVTEVVNGSRKLRTVQVRRVLDAWFVEGPTGLGATLRPAFRCKIECGSYAAANLEYTGANLIDLGATPTETVEFAAVAGVPDGCGSVFEVRNDADAAWLPFTDGQTAAEVGVSQRQTYKVRWRASPNGTNDATPILWEIGVRDVKKAWLSDLIKSIRARWSIPDVAELVPNIPEFEIVLIKNGEQDFSDRVTKLLSTNTIGSLAFRFWRGDPVRPRAEWLHKDDGALLDDYDPTAADVTILAHSPLVFVNGALPVYNTTTQKREPLQLANKTPKQVYAEIVNNQLAPDIPARYRGEGLIDESCLISQTIQDSDGLTELNAIHHVAGCVLSTCAGRLKSFPMFGPGAVQAVFPSQKIRWRSTSPGLRQRVPRFFVKYDYEPTSGAFRGEARLISGNDILATNLKPSRIDAVTELRDTVCRWVPTEELAKRIGKRRVDTLGAGMLVWSFTSTEPHPELEFGDVVAVETDRFFARDPSQVSQRTLKGALWAVCRVIEHDMEGKEFGVWVQSYTDIFGGSDVATRLGFAVPTLELPTLSVTRKGVVTAVLKTFGGQSIKYAVSTSAEPSATTVRAASPVAVDADGIYRTPTLATLTDGQQLYISAFAYEQTGGTGAESDLGTAVISYQHIGIANLMTDKEGIVFNGDFEGGFSGWGGEATAVIETGTPFAGAKALRITATTAGARYVFQVDDILDSNGGGALGSSFLNFVRVHPSERYRTRGYVKVSDNNLNAYFGFAIYDATKTSLGFVWASPLNGWSGVWSSWEANLQFASNVYYVVPVCGTDAFSGGAADGSLAYFDEFHVWRVKTNPDVNDMAAPKLTAGALVTGVQESGGKAVNRLFAKATAGATDDLDSVPDGATRKLGLHLIDTQTFTATGAGTWTKPAGAVLVIVDVVGAGGGGGGGRGGNALTTREGGQGGGGGARMRVSFNAADLGATEALSVGTGGTAGTGGSGGVGTIGGAGGDTWFGNATQASAKLWAFGGGPGGASYNGVTVQSGGSGGGILSAGAQGTAATNGGSPHNGLTGQGQGYGGAHVPLNGAGVPAVWGGASGAGNGSSSGAGSAGGVSQYGGGGGGSGGAVNGSNVEAAGGAGGNNTIGQTGGGGTAGAVNGGAGGAGAAGDATRSGQGGGGGGGQDSGTGGVGGAGGAPGGGGGGGGGGTTTGGAGGGGGRGEVRVYTYG